jgi:hypothetical protein
MGGKGVGAHFQKTMALEVLVGFIYIILELYLNDIIVFADAEEQVLERLELVYLRLESKRITLNPKNLNSDQQRLSLSAIRLTSLVSPFPKRNFRKWLRSEPRQLKRSYGRF